jgi:N-acetylglucosamine-6-sulfatase
MRKIVSVSLAGGVIFFVSYASSPPDRYEAQAQTVTTASDKPNIVFVLTDDMRKDDLEYMPKTKKLLQARGMTFQNAFVSNALCAPSRATIMRGQYSHNNGVWSNGPTNNASTSGGWQTYQSTGDELDNVATRLHDAGYRTALIGKYLNGYESTTDVPPGWDRWFAAVDPTTFRTVAYDINDDGSLRHYGTSDSDYKTDVLSRKTNAFITDSAPGGPFFAYVAPVAPHEPATPAPRDEDTYDGLHAPRSPSFDEKDVSDKPSWIRQLPRLTSDQIAEIDHRHEKRVESLQAVDDLVGKMVGTLKNAGVMDNTYILFTSDNGFHHGEHRITDGKSRSYEEDIHMPLVVRGPGVAAGSTTNKLALNTDYLPTFTALAGARKPPYVDGRSLKPVLSGSTTSRRNAVLLEAPANYDRPRPAYGGIRTVSTGTTTASKYVKYEGGEKELYRLDSDPYELTNRYDATNPPSGLASRIKTLRTCAADAVAPAVTCRVAEVGQ